MGFFISSSGVVTETDPDALHHNGSNSPTANINWGGFDLTNADSIFANISLVSPLLQGGSASGGSIDVQSTSDSTKGPVYIKDGSPLMLGTSATDQYAEYGSTASSMAAYNFALEGTTGYSGFFFSENARSAGGSTNNIDFGRSQGTFATPAYISNEDHLGSWTWWTFDEASPTFVSGVPVAAVQVRATENHASNIHGTSIHFAAIANGSGTLDVGNAPDLIVNGNGIAIKSGTAALPSLSFITDPNTGLFNSGADQVAVTLGGTQYYTFALDRLTATLPIRTPEIQIATSGNRIGSAVLVGGTVTVANTTVTASTLIFYSVSTAGGVQGFLSTTQIAATSFTINSTNALDTSTVSWWLVEPV